MKVKTSITLSQDILDQIDKSTTDSGSRSSFIEEVMRKYFESKERQIQDEKDFALLNKNAEKLNKEASEVLGYQVEF